MKKQICILSMACLLASFPVASQAQIAEDFNNVANLPLAGWTIRNNSTPAGTSSYFQGNPAVFPAQSGPANSYAAANFLNAGFGGNISDWLITPVMNFSVTSLLSFYTQSAGGAPDRLEVRISTSGFSTNVGATDTSLGDFTTLLLSINPTQSLLYPTTWTQVNIPLAAFDGLTGRLAFRYFVTNTATNGDYIGLDTVRVTGGSLVPESTGIVVPLIGFITVLGACRLRKAQEGGAV